MADREHPKTHVENQEDVTLPRTQPLSPQREGIDPLTESDTMYPAQETRRESEKLTKKENAKLAEADRSVDTVAQQTALQNPGEDRDVAADSTADTQADDAQRKQAELESPQADGKLPEDAKVANKVGSDKGNTSPSNKPATVDAPKSGTTESKTSSR